MKQNRRKLLIGTGAAAGAAAITAGAWWWRYASKEERAVQRPLTETPSVRDPEFPNPLKLPGRDGMFAVVDVSGPLTIVAKTVRYALLEGQPTTMLGYEVEHKGELFLNPVLKMRSGTEMRVTFWNALEEDSIVHWHGLRVDTNNDGHPNYAVSSGKVYDYRFQVIDRGGTYWYHPHPHGLTGKQLYLGLVGWFIVEDDEEAVLREKLDLAFGLTDVPLLIQDRRFNAHGHLVYAPGEHEWMHGYLGDRVLVNFTVRPYLDVATRIYRFRILNGSNARIYRLAFVSGERQLDFHVIGTDGGLLERAQPAAELFLAPAERADVLLDLRDARVGDAITLKSLAFDSMHVERAPRAGSEQHEHHHQQDDNLREGEPIDLLRLHVRRSEPYRRAMPAVLSRIATVDPAQSDPRVITLDYARGRWRINKLVYDMHATPLVVKRGGREFWEIRNARASMPHPMHIHGVPFQVVARAASPDHIARLGVDEAGRSASDLGWKDTVLVWPGETVRIAVDFSHPFFGDQVYMLHCHKLEHADRGQMLNLRIAQ